MYLGKINNAFFNILVFKPLPQPLSTGEGSRALCTRIAYNTKSSYVKGVLSKGSLSCGEGGGRGLDRNKLLIFHSLLSYNLTLFG